MRIGLMGGTFDPPHLGHFIPVESAADEFGLNRVWFIPAYAPPHKASEALTNVFDRTALLALALQRYPKFLLSTIELLQGKVCYTVDTISEFKNRSGSDDTLFFIMGSDSFLELRSWYEYQRLIRLCEIIIINRGDDLKELKDYLGQLEKEVQFDLASTVHFANAPFLPISSSEIRAAIREGDSVSGKLAPEVDDYIRKHSLYVRR
jgi:nicotinate-nucleotide adenylyltransferase